MRVIMDDKVYDMDRKQKKQFLKNLRSARAKNKKISTTPFGVVETMIYVLYSVALFWSSLASSFNRASFWLRITSFIL